MSSRPGEAVSHANKDAAHRIVTFLTIAATLSACTSRPAPVPPPQAESVHPVAFEQAGLSCLSQSPEVVVAHYQSEPVSFRSTCDTRSLDYVAAAGGLVGAVIALGVAAGCQGPDDGLYVDASSVVRDRFVEKLAPSGALPSLRSAPACPANDSVGTLNQTFGPQPVIDFKTVAWRKFGSEGRTFVPAIVRARLVDTAGAAVLWEEGCEFQTGAASSTGDVPAVQRALQQAAGICAEQFAARLAAGQS